MIPKVTRCLTAALIAMLDRDAVRTWTADAQPPTTSKEQTR